MNWFKKKKKLVVKKKKTSLQEEYEQKEALIHQLTNSVVELGEKLHLSEI